MPLVNCPECSGNVSDQAESCPHCGFPLVKVEYRFIEVYFNGRRARPKRSAEQWMEDR